MLISIFGSFSSFHCLLVLFPLFQVCIFLFILCFFVVVFFFCGWGVAKPKGARTAPMRIHFFVCSFFFFFFCHKEAWTEQTKNWTRTCSKMETRKLPGKRKNKEFRKKNWNNEEAAGTELTDELRKTVAIRMKNAELKSRDVFRTAIRKAPKKNKYEKD